MGKKLKVRGRPFTRRRAKAQARRRWAKATVAERKEHARKMHAARWGTKAA